ncbi:hypothetical protein EQG49_10490 [Periweissella cryptocerci]|uniref:Uncharacterized protein n=1 Tax=Periweissella cryptocerci TaxID=2506420 RepID=A0A4P6YVL4_9LACO|nr:hypothetical protein [Periweissella cryptocerci]QBO36840.1 hypothetical protein EQG49_10490 [Periweissella cryptocerci]
MFITMGILDVIGFGLFIAATNDRNNDQIKRRKPHTASEIASRLQHYQNDNCVMASRQVWKIAMMPKEPLTPNMSLEMMADWLSEHGMTITDPHPKSWWTSLVMHLNNGQVEEPHRLLNILEYMHETATPD